MLPEKGFGQLQVYSLIPKDLNPCEIKFHLTNGEIEDIEMSVMNSSFTRYRIEFVTNHISQDLNDFGNDSYLHCIVSISGV